MSQFNVSRVPCIGLNTVLQAFSCAPRDDDQVGENPLDGHTTAKTSFAQSRDFCREQKRGISAKKPFAERRSRQTRAVGNSQDCRGPASRQTTTLGEVGHFAESPARQKMTFGKMGLCRGPHSRQNQALGKTLPWAHRRDLP